MTVPDSNLEDIESSQEIGEFLQDILPHTDARDFLKRENLLDQKTETPRVAGILLFCDNPTPIFPKRCAIKIARYDTSEKNPKDFI